MPQIDARALYTSRTSSYSRFITAVLYPQGLRAFFRPWRPLRADARVLDAGCGFGITTFALLDAARDRGLGSLTVDAFDLTAAMLDGFRHALAKRKVSGVRLAEADVLHLEHLPEDWRNYDIVVSAAMLEYLPRERLADALGALRARMKPDGVLLVFISRRNVLMRWLIERWWHANLYCRQQLTAAFARADMTVRFRRFPLPYSHLNLWGVIAEARATACSEASR